MQKWLSIAICVLVGFLVSGYVFRLFSRKFVNSRRGDMNAPPKYELPVGRELPSVNGPCFEHPLITSREGHPVSRRNISDNALKVLYRLNSYGYEAYLVGGCIRDLYQGLQPKDFDVATSATPEEVRQLFRNSRLIGRRFKLVHINFGRETIEVATFRASHNASDPVSDSSHHSASGRILRDNVYGSMEDDALRRDFTINALYYDSKNLSVMDYCSGIVDIKQKCIRLIGDPVRRYHEDPVRMLRAIRFTVKLGFTMHEDTAAPLFNLGYMLRDIPSARLFDEMLKLFQSGYGAETFKNLVEYRLLNHLFPATNECIDAGDEYFEKLIQLVLMSTDGRIARGMAVTPAFLFAAFLWSPLKRLALNMEDQASPLIPILQQAAITVLENQSKHTSVPKRFAIAIRDIWDLQSRLERRQSRAITSLLGHQRFRAAYDFLILREESGEDLNGAGEWWTELQESSSVKRQNMIKELQSRKTKTFNNRRRNKLKPDNTRSKQDDLDG